MSIAESRSDAQTLIEPVMNPVTVFSAIRKAAASIERRAADVFAASSVILTFACAASALAISIAIL
jgi:hypothetical protein